jgi:hypothetical protein
VVWVKTALVAAVVVVAGWLFLSPPAVAVSSTNNVSCRPLGWEMPGVVSLYRYDGTVSGGTEAIDAAMETLGDTADAAQETQFREGVEAGLLAACGDARTNRLALMTIVLGAGIAVLVLVRNREPRASTAPVTQPRSADSTD